MEQLTTIRTELLTLTEQQLLAMLPTLVVILGAVLALVASVIKSVNTKWAVFTLSALTLIVGLAASVRLLPEASVPLFNGMMVSDSYTHFFNLVFLGSALVTALVSLKYLDREGMQHPEYNLLVLFSTIGMMVMASALDLVVVFIAFELMSLSVYSLVGFRRSDRRSNEAAMKYFILGGAASAVMLYGVALLYGVTGSTNIRVILEAAQASSAAQPMLFAIGAWLVIAGFLFKVASVPFHMWMPDVYEGAPVPVTGFMTTGLKAAAFATFVRVFVSMGYGRGLAEAIENHVHDVIWVTAVITMLVGNVIALTQTNLKRILAYSSIAHTGYILVGLIAGPHSEEGYAPILIYLVAYAVMNLGAFVVLTLLAARGDQGINLHDLSGVARRHPLLALSMAVFLFSMAGIPPTAGFIAKYLLFYSAIQAGEVVLVVIAVLCSAISVYYYLRVLVYMYMREPVGGESPLRVPVWSAVALAAMVVLTLQVGLIPAHVVDAAKRAIMTL